MILRLGVIQFLTPTVVHRLGNFFVIFAVTLLGPVTYMPSHQKMGAWPHGPPSIDAMI